VTSDDERTDALLALAACKGDQAAFASIMARHKAWLYQFIRRYVPDRDDAYDMLQESFVSAWGALPRYDPERPLRAWLRRIALNKCRDRARRQAVRKAALQLFGISGLWNADSTPPAAESEPASLAALRKLENAIATLPLQLKEPLILTTLEGLSHKDAGDLLGISPKAVETRVYRAKKRLATLLDPADLTDLAPGA
jgi:RNA polymerase sigma factor (sigma-70 family)